MKYAMMEIREVVSQIVLRVKLTLLVLGETQLLLQLVLALLVILFSLHSVFHFVGTGYSLEQKFVMTTIKEAAYLIAQELK